MLLQFTVKNFRSFYEEITLNMHATNITEHEDKIIVNTFDNEKYLPLAVIYGPNGGGKSNLIGAFYGLLSKVMHPICTICNKKDCHEKIKKFRITPFKFNNDSKKEATSFEVTFSTTKAEYKYSLSVKDETIINEKLFKKNKGTKNISKIFIRDFQEKTNIDINKSILRNINISGITETLPLLSFLGITYKENEVVKDILKWFESKIDIINYGNPFTESRVLLPKSKQFKELFLQMLQEMDIDICDYRVEEEENKDKFYIYTKHIINELENELELNEESSGTIKLFNLLPSVARSIIDGSILIVDELDSKLHPKLIEYIIELYRKPEINKSGAQLIFTSHDLMTMNSDLFRRDEIWFVAKTPYQYSQLYSLVEFKKENGKQPRKDEKYGKQYLEGRYGADPYLRRMINWEEQYESSKKEREI